MALLRQANYSTKSFSYPVQNIRCTTTHVLVFNDQSDFGLMDSDLNEINVTGIDSFTSIDLVPDTESLIFTKPDIMKNVRFDGAEVAETGPRGSVHIQNGHVWTAFMEGDDYAEISVLNLATLELVASTQIKDDSFFDAVVDVRAGFDNSVVLTFSQGQDGYWNKLATLEGDTIRHEFLGDHFQYAAVFNQSGDRFLTADEHALCVLTYPDEDLISSHAFERGVHFVYNYGFLDNTRVLFMAECGLFIFDTDTEHTEELVIEGFEPTVEVYENPTLQDSVVADFVNFTIVDDVIYITHSNDDGSSILRIDVSTVKDCLQGG